MAALIDKKLLWRKIFLPVLAFILILLVVGLFFVKRLSNPKKTVHFHAGFRVIVNNQLQDYSADKFMETEPCTVPGHQTNENDQLEKAHLHDGVGDVVHVHRLGATWKDLFKNIRVSFDPSLPAVGYENSKMVTDIMSQAIRPYESVVIVAGDQSRAQDYLKNAVTAEHIKEVEAKSETCGGTS